MNGDDDDLGLDGDDGSGFVPDGEVDAGDTDKQPRDENGRFVAKDAEGEDAAAEGADAAAAEGADAAAAEGADADKDKDADAGKDDAAGADKDKDADADKDKDADASKTVPYGRFREVVEQRRALQTRLDELTKATTTAAAKVDAAEDTSKALTEKLDGLYTQVEEARADGDVALAGSLQRQIDAIKDEKIRTEAIAAAEKRVIVAQNNALYDSMLDTLERARPVMDPDAPEFDARVVAEMDFQVKAYEKMGLTPPQALRRAAALIFQDDPFAPPSKRAAEKTDVKPPAERKTDVARNIDAARRNAPRVDRTEGNGDPKRIDISKLTDEELFALPKSTLDNLLGKEA